MDVAEYWIKKTINKGTESEDVSISHFATVDEAVKHIDVIRFGHGGLVNLETNFEYDGGTKVGSAWQS